MSKLEFLLGFDLGSALAKALNENKTPSDLFGDEFETIKEKWNKYYNDNDFKNGISASFRSKELPELVPDIMVWFNSIN